MDIDPWRLIPRGMDPLSSYRAIHSRGFHPRAIPKENTTAMNAIVRKQPEMNHTRMKEEQCPLARRINALRIKPPRIKALGQKPCLLYIV